MCLHYLDLRFCAAPEIATAILPPNWREGGGPVVAGAGFGGPAVGAVAAKDARDPEEIEAATRSRSTPGGVDPAPTNAPHPEHRDFGMFFSILHDGSVDVVAGFPIRLDKRPLGPRDTPQFAKKQEYL